MTEIHVLYNLMQAGVSEQNAITLIQHAKQYGYAQSMRYRIEHSFGNFSMKLMREKE